MYRQCFFGLRGNARANVSSTFVKALGSILSAFGQVFLEKQAWRELILPDISLNQCREKWNCRTYDLSVSHCVNLTTVIIRKAKFKQMFLFNFYSFSHGLCSFLLIRYPLPCLWFSAHLHSKQDVQEDVWEESNRAAFCILHNKLLQQSLFWYNTVSGPSLCCTDQSRR